MTVTEKICTNLMFLPRSGTQINQIRKILSRESVFCSMCTRFIIFVNGHTLRLHIFQLTRRQREFVKYILAKNEKEDSLNGYSNAVNTRRPDNDGWLVRFL